MSVELFKSCIEILDAEGLSSANFRKFFKEVKFELLGDGAAAIALVLTLTQSNEAESAPATLMNLLLDEARMGVENDSVFGPHFLEYVEMAVTGGIAAGIVTTKHMRILATQYKRADLSVPGILTMHPETETAPAPESDTILDDLGKHLETFAKEVQSQGGTVYNLFTGISEMISSMPEDKQAGFANHMVSLPNPVFERCGLYFLLSGTPLVREATAAGLLERLEGPGLQSDTLVYLPLIRGWMPAGVVRDAIDELGKRARRKNPEPQGHRRAPSKILDIAASFVDGTGSQSLSLAVRWDGKYYACLILTKADHGVKDAFVVPCDSLGEAEALMAQVRQETNGATVSQPTLRMLLEAALADGVQHASLPAPGILEVIEICQLFDLRPQPKPLPELLAFVDSAGQVQKVTAQTLGKWINNHDTLDSLMPLSLSWFEDNADVRQLIRQSRTGDAAETKIWKYLENRREIWAQRFLQTAAIFGDAGAIDEWKTLTASAYGLMNGRALKRIPLVKEIVYSTVEAAEARETG